MSAPASIRSWIPELDGLRAIAVLLVLFSHFSPRSMPFAWRIADVGWVGVDLFFVLSGFLITRILLGTRTRPTYYRDFYLRRTLRIFPLYYAVLAATYLTMLTWNHGEGFRALREWGNPLWSWLYLGNVQIALLGRTPKVLALAALWSLHVEEQFYLLFPLLVRWLRLRVLVWVLLGILVGAPLLRLLLWLYFPQNWYLNYMLLPCRFDALAYGALVAVASLQSWRPPRRTLGMMAVAALILVEVLYATVGHNSISSPFTRVWGYSMFPAAFALLVLWIVCYGNSAATDWLSCAPLRYLGRISYGIYLLQGPVAVALAVLLAGTRVWGSDVVQFLLISATTVALAALSWQFFEAPLLRLKDRIAPVMPEEPKRQPA